MRVSASALCVGACVEDRAHTWRLEDNTGVGPFLDFTCVPATQT